MRYNRDSWSKSFELGVMKQSLVKDKSYRFALERIRLAQGSVNNGNLSLLARFCGREQALART
jgi:hypothetical protein